ncbi:hypothetical protein J4407_02720 [Candidatus Pacearchaeota archaeon]|nr:hypothetical protein [Candidatus Pacearchaeota archaeon]
MSVVESKESLDQVKPDGLVLLVNNCDESQEALDFLYRHELNVKIVLGEERAKDWHHFYSEDDDFYRNSFNEPSPPSLIVTSFNESSNSSGRYTSLSGIRAYLRYKLLNELMEKEGFEKSDWKDFFYWTNVETFYPSQEYEENRFGKKQNLVTCFNQKRGKIFEGPIDRAPFKMESQMNQHRYNDWHKVSSWEIGKLKELSGLKNEKGIIIKPETRTVLFEEELADLQSGRKDKIIVADNASIMHVNYEVYFNDEGVLRGIYANMFD